MKVPLIIYYELESLFEKINLFYNNPKKSSTNIINEHTASGFSLFTNCSFHTTKSKLRFDRGKECMKNFFTDLRKHITKIISYEKK